MLLDGARQAGILVIYIQVGFRQGYPEVGRRNPMFSSIEQSGRFLLPATLAPTFTRPSDRCRAILLW